MAFVATAASVLFWTLSSCMPVMAQIRLITCEEMVLAVDMETVNSCNALQAINVSSVKTDIFVKPVCGASNGNMCHKLAGNASSELDYSLDGFTATPLYKLQNNRCVDSISLRWKLRRNSNLNENSNRRVIRSNKAVDYSDTVDQSLSSENEYSRDVSTDDSDRPADNDNYTSVTVNLCVFQTEPFYPLCALQIAVRAQIPKNRPPDVVEFTYNCLSFKHGWYQITLNACSADDTEGLKATVYAGKYGCPVLNPATNAPDRVNQSFIGLPAEYPPSPKDDGPLILICVISITVALIIALTALLVVVTHRRSRRMRQGAVSSQSCSSDSALIANDHSRARGGDDDSDCTVLVVTVQANVLPR